MVFRRPLKISGCNALGLAFHFPLAFVVFSLWHTHPSLIGTILYCWALHSVLFSPNSNFSPFRALTYFEGWRMGQSFDFPPWTFAFFNLSFHFLFPLYNLGGRPHHPPPSKCASPPLAPPGCSRTFRPMKVRPTCFSRRRLVLV